MKLLGPAWRIAALTIAFLSVLAPSSSGQVGLARSLVLETTLAGTDEQDVRWPVAVATSSGEIAVADAFGPRLLLFRGSRASWQLESSVELPGAPVDLVHDGRRYVASLRGIQGLVAFEGDKLVQRRLALPRGVVPGPLAALPDGGLLVFDHAEERVLKLDADGKLGREMKVEGRVTALAATPSGGFLATVGETGTLLHHDANGDRDGTWQLPGEGPVPAWPSGVVADPVGGVLVLDRHGDRVLLLDTTGKTIGVGSRRGAEPGLVRFPSAITLLDDGRVVVADQGNGRVQIFRRADRDPAR